jgi:KUP system potassium uptake protein
MIAALGVVFGDIGTSPLYAFKETMNPEHGVPFSPDSVLGLLSLIFWGLMFVVTLKYVVFVLRADHDGEGGILALQALARSAVAGPKTRPWVWNVIGMLGLVGAAMFYGDSLITPAISVLSAVEGLEVQAPVLQRAVLPDHRGDPDRAVRGAAQGHGRGRQGVRADHAAVVPGAGGGGAVADLAAAAGAGGARPAPCRGLPVRAPGAVAGGAGRGVPGVHGRRGAVCRHGAFRRRPIRLAWLFIALPGLVLNYFGQGALVLGNPAAIDNPFFRLFPSWGVLPMVVLAAMATVIASQAVISGAFSLTAHAMRMGYLPRMRVVQTSGSAIGQIYVPAVNWLLMVGVLLLVLGFRSSGALSAAYGIAVSITMVTTTLLAGIVAWGLWRWNKVAVVVGVAAFAVVDLTFVVANSLKIAEGGWLTLAVAAGVMCSSPPGPRAAGWGWKPRRPRACRCAPSSSRWRCTCRTG